jgi:hypothetical protein
MSGKDKPLVRAARDEDAVRAPAPRATPVVVRSTDVPAGLPYREYKPYLRDDFWYSCAYCTMTEHEAQAIRFVIDHYEPQVSRPELINEYTNLMYSCDECNDRKGDRDPPAEARALGHRILKIDADVRSEHFRLDGNRVEGISNVGKYTVDAVDLNRPSLVRLRELRQRLFDYDAYVGEGIMALSSFPLDALDPRIRTAALAAINKAMETAEKVYDDLDAALEAFSKSDILVIGDTEEEKKRNQERRARIRELEGIYPGSWRGRKSRKRRH